ncbi:MAG: hypothetical protein Q8J85_04775 [Sulfuricurvum sp.]|nr:hypothetical protein [Sulfuricurvum sp.]MDP3022719.1 hypothetical protein [Sulfuricurvum sp.]
MIKVNDVVLMDGDYLLVKSLSEDGKMVEVTSGGEHGKYICSLDYVMQNNEKIMSMYECLEYELSELDAAILQEKEFKAKMKKAV